MVRQPERRQLTIIIPARRGEPLPPGKFPNRLTTTIMETLCPICSNSHWSERGHGPCITCQDERGGIYAPAPEPAIPLGINLRATVLARTLEAMEARGGNFVKLLAACARAADSIHLARLAIAFPEIWQRYQDDKAA